MKRPARRFVVAVLAAALGPGPIVSAGVPIPVSPGAPDRIVGVGSPCPTFSWSAVDGAAGYDLVVYAASAEAVGVASDSQPVLRARIPSGATVWTPAAEDCLELEGSYAWLVRAAGGGEAEWSESRLFRVDVDAVLKEIAPILERAIERELRRRSAATLAATAETTAARPSPASAGGQAPAPGAASPGTRGVFTDDVELWLEESGSAASDKVQLVFATPEFDGDPSDAWAIVVDASATATDPGKMFFSSPSFFDTLQLFTDGTAIIGDLREFRILPSSGPPFPCTSSLLQGGAVYYDSNINALCVCDGSSWAPIDSDNMGSCS